MKEARHIAHYEMSYRPVTGEKRTLYHPMFRYGRVMLQAKEGAINIRTMWVHNDHIFSNTKTFDTNEFL